MRWLTAGALLVALSSGVWAQQAEDVAAIREEAREAKAHLKEVGAEAFKNQVIYCYLQARDKAEYKDRFKQARLCVARDYVGLIAYMGMKRALGPKFVDEFYEPKTQDERIKTFLTGDLGAPEQTHKRFTDPIFAITFDEFVKEQKQ